MKRTRTFSALLTAGILTFGGIGYQAVAQHGEKDGKKPMVPMMQCPMMQTMKSIELHASSPDVLVAQADQLELTDEQRKRLREIAEHARNQAREVLTETQQQQLEEKAAGPLTPMELVKLVATNRNESEQGEKQMMCPMCTKMMEKKAERK